MQSLTQKKRTRNSYDSDFKIAVQTGVLTKEETHNIADYDSLVKHLKKCIPEYNNIRPHCAHKYLTPAQVYFGKGIDLGKIKKQLEEARKIRIIENKKVNCPGCSS